MMWQRNPLSFLDPSQFRIFEFVCKHDAEKTILGCEFWGMRGAILMNNRLFLMILLFAHVRCFKILLLANVWASFLKWFEKCERQILTVVFAMSNLSYISNDFHWFYVVVTRRRFGDVAKHATDLLRLEALKAADVHETTLCVTFGALLFGTNFCVPAWCAKY